MGADGMPDLTLDGAVDLHVHGAPDVIARRHTDIELARRARVAGMQAIVLKSHHESTVGRAALARETTGFGVFGGLVLNSFVSGGLDPAVVEAALALGARVIWLPTLSSSAHIRAFGRTEMGWTDRTRDPATVPATVRPVSLRSEAARSALRRICDLTARAGAILASGHAEAGAIGVVGAMARDAQARFLVTHPEYRVPHLTLSAQRRLATELPNVVFERCAYVTSPASPHSVRLQTIANGIRTTGGPARNVIASDLGQAANAPYPTGLLAFANALMAAGLAIGDVRTMLRITPGRLLGLGEGPG